MSLCLSRPGAQSLCSQPSCYEHGELLWGEFSAPGDAQEAGKAGVQEGMLERAGLLSSWFWFSSSAPARDPNHSDLWCCVEGEASEDTSISLGAVTFMWLKCLFAAPVLWGRGQ